MTSTGHDVQHMKYLLHSACALDEATKHLIGRNKTVFFFYDLVSIQTNYCHLLTAARLNIIKIHYYHPLLAYTD